MNKIVTAKKRATQNYKWIKDIYARLDELKREIAEIKSRLEALEER